MTGYFVNTNTGELAKFDEDKLFPTHVEFPQFNTFGWSRLTKFEYRVMLNVFDNGWVHGVQDEITTNGEGE